MQMHKDIKGAKVVSVKSQRCRVTTSSEYDSSDEMDEVGTHTDEISLEESMKRQSLFAVHDLAIKVGDTVLHVNRDQLMAESPVFKDLLSSVEYKDKNKELELDDVNVNTVVDFLRCTMPGIYEAFTDKTVQDVLPLAYQYKTERVLTKADKFLANKCKQLGKRISSEQTVENLLQAEKYQLTCFLEECIDVASKKCFDYFVKHRRFEEISKETRLKISLKRWKEMDDILKVSGRFARTEIEDFHKPLALRSSNNAVPTLKNESKGFSFGATTNRDVTSDLTPYMTMN